MKDMKTMKNKKTSCPSCSSWLNSVWFWLGSEAALEAKRPWKRSGLGSEAALEAKWPWKRSGLDQVMTLLMRLLLPAQGRDNAQV
jgi:hypothetical protein